MSVVTTPEFTNYLSGLNITDIQEQSMEAILAGVQSELEQHLGRPVQKRRVVEEVEVDMNGLAYLSVTPIMNVYGLYHLDPTTGERGEAITMESLPGGWYRRGANFLRLGWGGCRTVVVDYMGGHNADLDPGMKLAIMRVAAREFEHQHGDTMALVNTETRPKADPVPQPKGWTEEELAKFDRLRRRVVL